MKSLPRFLVGPALVTPLLAGPFPPAAGVAGTDAIPAKDPRISLWANGATVVRGLANIAYPEDEIYATFGTDTNALGPADATENPEVAPVVSLGDGGTATVTFAAPVGDVPGPDIAVFENGFKTFSNAYFLELAHVEVSSDGVHFYRFPSTSLTPLGATLGQGSGVDPTNIRNLAGKHIAGFGTPFDLAELRPLHPQLDIQRVTHVRVVDVVGTNDPAFATRDAAGRIVADPYPTEYPTGGFDLDAVGAFKATTTTYAAWAAAQGFPGASPAADSDKDGISNGIAFFTGNGSLAISGNELRYSRLAYRAGGNLDFQGSPDLADWTTLARSVNGAATVATGPVTAGESGDTRKEVTIVLPAQSAYRYFRLAAEIVP